MLFTQLNSIDSCWHYLKTSGSTGHITLQTHNFFFINYLIQGRSYYDVFMFFRWYVSNMVGIIAGVDIFTNIEGQLLAYFLHILEKCKYKTQMSRRYYPVYRSAFIKHI